MEPKHFIAIDLGATSGRAILATVSAERTEMETLHRFPNRLVCLGGKYYWNIYALYEEIVEGLRQAGRRGVRIESIGIDTWGVDMAFVAQDGTLAGLPRAYRDPYTDGVPEAFFAAKMPRREVYDRTGIQFLNFNSLYQLYAAREEGCTALEQARHILFIPDALAYLLTGEAVCEYTVLSTSQFMNPRTKRPDAELLAAAGVDASLFPRAVMPGERIGTLNAAVARETGLGAVPVIAVAGHDTGSAVAAVPAENERFAYLSSGTWSLMGIELPEPVIDDRTYALNFTNEGGVDGTVRLLKNITGMWLLEQCRAAWARAGKEYAYPEIVRMTETAAPSAGLLDPDAAEFAAPTDMPQAIRSWCRSHGVAQPADDAATMRLIFDSLAAKYADVLRKLQSLAPFEIECLHVIGGGAQNELLNRLTATACGIPVVAGPTEATALGNILVQARAAGLAGSLAEMRRHIRRSTEVKRYNPEKR
ncbi:MAG: rhamnulokinase [Alistipes sp.]|nr:rhamnulokinase [Alistipes sp.]